jgi:hypothetical protein
MRLTWFLVFAQLVRSYAAVRDAATRLAAGSSTIDPRIAPLWTLQEGTFRNTAGIG